MHRLHVYIISQFINQNNNFLNNLFVNTAECKRKTKINNQKLHSSLLLAPISHTFILMYQNKQSIKSNQL